MNGALTPSHAETLRPVAEQVGRVLARDAAAWHGAAMEQNSGKASRAGGAILAFTIIAGAVVGNHYGQPSMGMLIGTGIGVAIAVALYLMDRARS